ncbi:MAG: type IX secretion system sortase PorU [Bacteroidales bacterium]|jgi:hypothetical protein|nr:type IX secretion system sortase PorU [Bacteroidales bacterium]
MVYRKYLSGLFAVGMLKSACGGLCLLLALFSEAQAASVMASGKWYRIALAQDGIYRIRYEDLLALGLDDPAAVRIYGSGGAMLPEKADGNATADLKEIPVMMMCKTDGVFTYGDCILFYGQGPARWRYNAERRRFEHSLHLWDSRSYCFITSKAGGKRITADAPPAAAPTHAVAEFDDRLFHEEELYNVINSGRYWYGEFFHTPPSHSFSFAVPGVMAGAPASVEVAFLTRSAGQTFLEVSHNRQPIAVQPLGIYGQEYAVETLFDASFAASSDRFDIELTLNANGNANAQGWLNYIRLQVRRKLEMNVSQLFFRDVQSTGAGNVSRFSVAGCTPDVQVWDVTDMHAVRRMNAALSGSVLSFSATADTLREFVAFRASEGLLQPVFPEGGAQTANQNLHDMDADMLIVTHPDFAEASARLADLHRQTDGLTVEVATTEQVYNEFSSGMQDPAAIRNFAKTVHEKSGRLKYLLLTGDGSFDNKSNMSRDGNAQGNTHRVVTYQSAESLHTTRSYVSDDYFGILDDGADVLNGSLTVGVGRLPVQTPEEAQNAVNKIRKYVETPFSGDWANLVALLADDEDGNIHTRQSDSIASYLRLYQPQYTVEKLYFDAFPQLPTADGHRYPEVAARLDDLLNSGCFLVNYIGHGNASGLSEERVVNATRIDGWKNGIYPLFVAATCEFGRYDDFQRITAGEKTLLNPSGGAIALLTSARLVYSGLNFQFTEKFFRALFAASSDGAPCRLGDVVRLSKNASDAGVNKLCFALLGDPALRLPVPTNRVRTVAVNGRSLAEPADTLKANARVTVRAEITDGAGQKLASFNGMAHVSLFDKARETTTLNNDGNAPPVTFETQTSLLFGGKATVRGGEFEIAFVMPRDINYRYGFGKISYFACDGREIAAGACDTIMTGGSDAALEDFSGPEIRLFMNDTLFRNGGVTDGNPVLLALLADENGINTAEGIGHGVTATLNSAPTDVYRLNDCYEAEPDNYRKGRVTYRFSGLSAGDYELTLSAWDVANNPSQAVMHFRVAQSDVLQIAGLYNYPNPFSDRTRIYFEYNLPNEPVEVEVQIFDLSGRLLHLIRQTLISEGYTSGEFHWDGRDAGGNLLHNGIYPYRVILRSRRGAEAVQTSKMALAR